MALLLPETLNRPLPETIEEIESWTRSANKSLDPQAYSASVTGPKNSEISKHVHVQAYRKILILLIKK